MNNFLLFGLFLGSFMIAGCSDDSAVQEDEVIIERQEDYHRENPAKEESVPLPSNDEVDIN